VISPYPEKNKGLFRQKWYYALGVILLAMLPLLGALGGGFLCVDDSEFVLENPIMGPISPARVLKAFTTSPYGIYYPVAQISLSIDYAVDRVAKKLSSLFTGENSERDSRDSDKAPGAFFFRLTNLLLHAVNSLLILWLAARLAGRFGLHKAEERIMFALLAGCIFAMHPIHAEPVAWVSGRVHLLVVLWVLLGMHAVLSAFLRAEHEGTALYVILACVCAAAAVLSGPLGVVVPVIFFLTGILVYRPAARPQFIGIVGTSIVIIFVALILGVFGVGNRFTPPLGSAQLGIMAGLNGVFLYTRNVFVPLWLHFPYELGVFSYPDTWLRQEIIIGAAGCALWLAAFIISVGKNIKVLWFGLVFIAVVVLCDFGVVPIRTFAFVSDSLFYLGLVGVALIGAWCLTLIMGPLARTSLLAAMALIVGTFGFYGVETIRLGRNWTSNEEFISGNLALNPNSGMLLLKMGETLARDGKSLKGGVRAIEFAIDVEPKNYAAYIRLADVISNTDYLGGDKYLQGHFSVAVKLALEALAGVSGVDRRLAAGLCLQAAQLKHAQNDIRSALHYLNQAFKFSYGDRTEARKALVLLNRLALSAPLEMQHIKKFGENSPLAKAFMMLGKNYAGFIQKMTYEECMKEGGIFSRMALPAKSLVFYGRAKIMKKYDLAANLKYFKVLEVLNRKRAIMRMRKFRSSLFKSEQGRPILKDVTYELGLMYCRAGDYDSADATLQSAASIKDKGQTPDLAEKIVIALAEAQSRNGKRDKAIALLQEFVNRTDSAGAREKLKELRAREEE